MDIKQQARLIRRIQADLRMESIKHRSEGNGMAAADCEGQADALDSVLSTPKAVDMMNAAAASLKSCDAPEAQ